MGLKDTWVDKKDGVDINSADDINQVAHAVIELEKNGVGGGIAVEADPTVSDWAKQPNKPTYTASEVGAVSQTELEGAVDNALAQAKESGEFDGSDGRGIKSVARTSGTGAAGTTDTYTITYTDNTTSTFTVYNGKNGTNGKDGQNGSDGKDGADGKDYVLTEADKAEIAVIVEDNAKGEIIQSIVAELQTFPVFGYIDENNAITVTSLLLDGTYTLKYENEDGTKTEIGTIIVGTGTGEGSGGDYTPTYVNIISTAKTPTDLTTVFNDGKGYMDGKYASSSSPYYGADGATFVTGLIEATPTSVFYVKGVTIDTSNNHNRLGVFNTSGSPNEVKPFTQMTDYATLETLGTQYYKLTMNTTYISANFTNFKYIMFSAMGSGANCIIATTPIEE